MSPRGTNRARRLACCALVMGATWLALALTARADYLVASRAALLKDAPASDAGIVAHVARGDTLSLLDDGQTAGHYRAQLADGDARGWIHRNLVRRFRDQASTDAGAGRTSARARGTSAAATAASTAITVGRGHLALGMPQPVYQITREGYALAVDARLKIPLWVQYELRGQDLDGSATRTDAFRADPDLPLQARAKDIDYLNNEQGYARGHMAPAEDMSRNARTMDESFFFSNMCPQVQNGFNNGVWSKLEARVRNWAEARGRLAVIVGPVFTAEQGRVTYEVIGPDRVAVPPAFFKIVVDPDAAGGPQAVAFLLPNKALPGADPDDYRTTVDAIEDATCLDFLSALPANVQDRVEASDVAWP